MDLNRSAFNVNITVKYGINALQLLELALRLFTFSNFISFPEATVYVALIFPIVWRQQKRGAWQSENVVVRAEGSSRSGGR